MTGTIDAKLAELGITLPAGPMPAANYVPFVQTGNLVYISGQISMDENGMMTGKVGADVDVETAQIAARRCGLSLIAQLKAACGGDLDRMERVVKINGFVNGTPDFEHHPAVINGCSDLMVEIFGDKGRHARAAVGCGSLPFNVQVEIEGIFQIA